MKESQNDIKSANISFIWINWQPIIEMNWRLQRMENKTSNRFQAPCYCSEIPSVSTYHWSDIKTRADGGSFGSWHQILHKALHKCLCVDFGFSSGTRLGAHFIQHLSGLVSHTELWSWAHAAVGLELEDQHQPHSRDNKAPGLWVPRVQFVSHCRIQNTSVTSCFFMILRALCPSYGYAEVSCSDLDTARGISFRLHH